MSNCSEIAIFRVPKENIPSVIALSLSVVNEINANGTVITSHNVWRKTDNEEELCWHFTWVNQEAVKLTTKKWPYYPSTKALESLVGEKIYYGHFIGVV